jgi:nitroreductase
MKTEGGPMELLEAIQTRHSVRGFLATPVPEEAIEEIVRAVAASPSHTNTQPWKIAVVTGRSRDELSEILVALAEAKAPTDPDVPRPAPWPPDLEARSRQHGARRLATLGVAREDTEGRDRLRVMNFEFYGAPCAMFLFTDGVLSERSTFDMGLCAQNLVLAAHALGLGTVLQASVTDYADAIRDYLGLPESLRLIVGVSVGYADDAAVLNRYRALKQEPAEFTMRYS